MGRIEEGKKEKKGISMKQRLIVYVGILTVLAGILGTMIITLVYRNSDAMLANRARVLVNDCVYQANRGNLQELDAYPYVILDHRGIILDSNQDQYPVDARIALETITGNTYGDKKKGVYIYSNPFVQNEEQIGTIFVDIPYEKLQQHPKNMLVIMVIILTSFLLVVVSLVRWVIKDILVPIRQVHQTTKKIREGSFEERVKYDYASEIGVLCHDFEALREELAYSIASEKRMKEKEKLLLAYISHDLRTPIAIISGYVEGIHTGLAKGERVKEYTTIILKKITMLNGLIDDILEHSKAQLYEFTICKEECYAKEYFEELVKEMKNDVEKRGLLFLTNEIPNVMINIDKKRIRQVIQNLIGNAIKFTTQGSISLLFAYKESKLSISVQDTGIGIAPSDLSMIFEPFYRGEKARTLNVQGTGLGLSISKYIVTQHGGRIMVDSVPKEGTSMEFTLPVE
ncbi:sensor histidine kinase [Anaerosporobacter faecicola]|uniref:sensor histidine kinase n=1 Tax=Anaerosporobacter faecicola TaxID=2718714 RepID=UPI00143A5AE4|nr:HAMP domain-containing sensor histidine kinase [Anaerosporobacter faecicola]